MHNLVLGMFLTHPRYTKRLLHKDYLNFQIDKSMHLSLMTFIDVLERDLPHIRLSLRARVLCDLCFLFRETVRTVSDKHLVERAEEWRSHLNTAENTRISYRASQAFARKIFRSIRSERLTMASISFDYAKQLTVPMLSDQTMNEWFSQKKGHDVNLFDIIDEGIGDSGLQYNYIYGEGTKHGSVQVASMLHHFFNVECPRLGESEVLHLHTDSCTGQNKNSIVLGYLILRVAHGFHDEIL